MPIPSLADNPFVALTFIAAPAILTNASSVLALGTSNRFARAIDRSRALHTQMETTDPGTDDEWARLRIRQMGRLQKRVVLLVNALTFFYTALGSFGSASLVSLLGAVFVDTQNRFLFHICSVIALLAGVVGVGSLVFGCTLLVTETRYAVANLSEEADMIRTKYKDYVVKSDRAD